jgi:hypothetical protein
MRQAVDGRHHALQHRVKKRASLFRVAVGQECHGALEVGEQHRDLLTLPSRARRDVKIFSAREWGV